jgi:hypothetical protein
LQRFKALSLTLIVKELQRVLPSSSIGMMPSFKGIQCSLMLGPERRQAREIKEQTTQNTVMTVIEVEGGEFAFKLRLN